VLEKSDRDEIALARIRFGPHYVVEVQKVGAGVAFTLLATHHGFRADASEVDGELEQIIDEVRGGHPNLIVD